MIYSAIDYWNSSYISHHGVKGMKWGVRHDRERLGKSRSLQSGNSRTVKTNNRGKFLKKVAIGTAVTAGTIFAAYGVYKALQTPEGRKTIANGLNQARKMGFTTKKDRLNNSEYANAKTMTDEQLRKATNRINLEQNYLNAVRRDQESYEDARHSNAYKVGRDFVLGVGVVGLGSHLARNALQNSLANKYPIVAKPSKKYKG